MGVIGEQGLPCGGMGATDDPVVATKALANLVIGVLEKNLNRLREGSGQVWRALGCYGAGRSTTASFQHGIRLHVVVIIFITSVRCGTLRAIIDNLGVADDEMIHRGFFREEILRTVCPGAFRDFGAIQFSLPSVRQSAIHV